MFKTIIKILILIVLIAIIAYVALTCYFNFFADGPSVKIPDISKAQYSFTIEGTGNVVFSDDYEKTPTGYILHGYWERIDDKFKFRKHDLVLDERIFGSITLRRR